MAPGPKSRRQPGRVEPEPERVAEAEGGASEAQTSAEGRTMTLVKQVGVVVGLLSGAIGLVFLLFPQYRPEPSEPTPDQSAAITGVVMNARTTRGQYLDYSDQSKLGFTKQQLGIVGASAFARVQIIGYRGRTLTLARQIVDARNGDVVGQARDFLVTPPAEKVSHRWWDWVPLPKGRGSYVIVIKLLDDEQAGAIACGQTPPFGGLDGSVAATPPRICERQPAGA
jgi:hypothetical protein